MTVLNTNSTTNPPWYVSGIAGSLGQITELTLGGHILNRVATQQQTDPRLSLARAVKKIYEQDGARGFFKGYRWNAALGVCKGFTRWSVNNAMFSIFDRVIPKRTQESHSWIVPVAVGIGGAAFETTLYLCPLESLKTREMTENWGQRTQMWKVIRQEGIPIFFRGWTGLFPRQAITWATYLLAYDKYREIVLDLRRGEPVRTVDKFLMNFMTGATAAALTTPLDLYKTQRQKVEPIQQKNMFGSMRALLHNHGWHGIYRSLPIRIGRSGFYAMATFTVMDYFNALPGRMKV